MSSDFILNIWRSCDKSQVLTPHDGAVEVAAKLAGALQNVGGVTLHDVGEFLSRWDQNFVFPGVKRELSNFGTKAGGDLEEGHHSEGFSLGAVEGSGGESPKLEERRGLEGVPAPPERGKRVAAVRFEDLQGSGQVEVKSFEVKVVHVVLERGSSDGEVGVHLLVYGVLLRELVGEHQ